MLAEMQFADETLVDDIVRGFDLAGTAGSEGLLPADFPASHAHHRGPWRLMLPRVTKGHHETLANPVVLRR